jgi:hypothetical protein
MTTPNPNQNSRDYYAQTEAKIPLAQSAIDAIENFTKVYDARASFFIDGFVRKVKEGNRKALGELSKHAMPPTQMDLRSELAKCIHACVPDDHVFFLKDGKQYTMKELKLLVPEWCSIAEKALMESDPAMADRLMSSAQWNAKTAFEVAFGTAMNEMKNIKLTKNVTGDFDHYVKWVLAPLTHAITHIRSVNPPGNCLIGYGDRVSLKQALVVAEGLPGEFQKMVAKLR